MRVLISGAGGMIGQAVGEMLSARRHELRRLVRDPSQAQPGDVAWQPGSPPEAAQLAGFDAIVHLAGSPVARRWTKAAKAEILNSRVQGTETLAQAAAHSRAECGRPEVFVCASAVGYYGDRGDEELEEESHAGLGFLADLCRSWECASQPAARAALRVAQMRMGLVLSPAGGALAGMLPGFRLGVAGRLGSGRQWWSWISLRDVARAFAFALESPALHGPLNLTSPRPVTNAEFTRTLAAVLHRPAVLPVPRWALRMAGGELADELLLASQRALPKRLLEAGFCFEDTELEATLRRLLSTPANPSR